MKQNIHYFIQQLNVLHSCMRNVILFKISKYTHNLYAYVAHTDTKKTRMKEVPVEYRAQMIGTRVPCTGENIIMFTGVGYLLT
jgi:hypothetical protein